MRYRTATVQMLPSLENGSYRTKLLFFQSLLLEQPMRNPFVVPSAHLFCRDIRRFAHTAEPFLLPVDDNSFIPHRCVPLFVGHENLIPLRHVTIMRQKMKTSPRESVGKTTHTHGTQMNTHRGKNQRGRGDTHARRQNEREHNSQR